MTTIREFDTLHFMNVVIDKQNWHIKEIMKQWEEELLASDLDMTSNMIQ